MSAVGNVPIRYGVLPSNYPHNYQIISIYIILLTPVDSGYRILSWNALMGRTPLSTGDGVGWGAQLSNNLNITPI